MADIAFYTTSLDFEGQSAEEMLQESARLMERQKAIDALLRGEIDPATVLDLIEFHGINPAAYMDCVEDNLRFLWPGLL